MAQVIDTSGDEAIVRSDIKTPPDTNPPETQKTVVVIDNFRIGDREERIEFVLDERFRERVDAALQELIDRAIGLVFDPTDKIERDFTNAVTLDLGTEGRNFISIIMKHDLFRDDQVFKIIDTKFKELV